MAGIGARYICFAPFSGEEPAAALPKYGQKINFGKLVKAELTVTMASGKIYGDDVLDESIDEFISAALAIETTDLTLEHEAVLFGSTMEEEGNELSDSIEDTIPYGGIVYIKRNSERTFSRKPRLRLVRTARTRKRNPSQWRRHRPPSRFLRRTQETGVPCRVRYLCARQRMVRRKARCRTRWISRKA